MSTKVGINGFGRIGRNVFRVAMNNPEVEIVAINDPGNIEALAHLLQYDSVHGEIDAKIEIKGSALVIDGKEIEVTQELDPAKIPWGTNGAEVVIESTGRFTNAEDAKKHLVTVNLKNGYICMKR